ncbi:hypothetical protein, partial [Streptomyces sp. NPDC057412]|uniref:hypothetical protein n=1 Tax=Streptomyces sp. NPDC057412 TaxID=3346123 RepID=UPI003678C1BC
MATALAGGVIGILVLAYATVRRVTPESFKISATIARCASFSVEIKAARQFRLDQWVVGPGVPLTDVQWARIEPLLP